jgi:hypothetical protein
LAALLQRLTCLKSARFHARAPGPVSGQLCRAPGRRTGHGAGFPSPFGRRHSLPGHPVPPGDSAPLAIGLPHRPAGGADPSGVSMFRTRERGQGPGALYTPGTAVPARPRMRPVTAACRLAAAGPCHPGATTRPGASLSRGISKGSLAFAPPGHSLACNPRTERAPLGFTPGLRTRPGRTQPRTPGRERASGTGPESRRRHQRPPSTQLTHRERPHVATHLKGVLPARRR